MKTLITVSDINNRAARGEKSVYLDKDAIITPAARDAAREKGIKIIRNEQNDLLSIVKNNLPNGQADPELVARIVKEVLAVLGYKDCNPGPVVERDKSGMRLVRGDTVVCEPFSTGNPEDKVFLKDLLPVSESPNMAAGFMEMENSSFEWELKYDEYDYVIDGELEIIVDGQSYRGKPGDVFFIPRGTRIIFSSPGKVKFFYTTYPANWQELE